MTGISFKRKLLHLAFLIKRPMTLGVRLIAQNDLDEVLLVKHTYVSGWYLPGGGVEKGYSTEQTAHKELLEETGYQTKSEMKLLGVYFHFAISKRDHVVVYSCKDLECAKVFEPNWEIAEIGFFSLNELPEDLKGESRSQLEDFLSSQASL